MGLIRCWCLNCFKFNLNNGFVNGYLIVFGKVNILISFKNISVFVKLLSLRLRFEMVGSICGGFEVVSMELWVILE